MRRLIGLCLALAVFAGCSSSTDQFNGSTGPNGSTGTVQVIHPAGTASRQPGLPEPPVPDPSSPPTGLPSPGPTPRPSASANVGVGGPIPNNVDTLEFKGFNSAGKVVFGWPAGAAVRYPAGTNVTVNSVPRTVTRLRIDYLRNAGYPIRRYETSLDLSSGQQVIVNPNHETAPTPTTSFNITKLGAGNYTLAVNNQTIKVLGVDYSPISIGDSTGYLADVGDKFWATPNPSFYGDWSALWRRDLPNLRGLNVNCIRTYQIWPWTLTSNGPPAAGNQTAAQARNYEPFLDMCWNNGEQPVYVVLGISLDAHEIDKAGYDATWDSYIQNIITFVATSYGTHPALMGICVGNEQNNPTRCYDSNDPTHFFWNQCQLYANLFKTQAAGKLTTIGFQYDANLYKNSPIGMALCTSIDMWGDNPYTGQDFTPLWQDYEANVLNTTIEKPLLLTEWGCPSTGHRDATQASIYENDQTQQLAANQIQNNLTDLYTANGTSGNSRHLGYALGGFYFEYSDEWWNQVDFTLNPPALHVPWQWYGGTASGGFANGYWDQDGFGLYNTTIQPARVLPSPTPLASPNIPAQYPYTYWLTPPHVNGPADPANPGQFLPDILQGRKAATTVGTFFTTLAPSPSP